MKKIFRRFNTVFFKLTASYVLIIILSVILTGALANYIFQTNFNQQVSESNEVILRDLREFFEKDILSKANGLYVSLVEGEHNKDFKDALYEDWRTDYRRMNDIKNLLSTQQVANADWLSGLYTYFVNSDVLVGANGVIYKPDGRSELPEWYSDLKEGTGGFAYVPTIPMDSIYSLDRENAFFLVRKVTYRGENRAIIFFQVNEPAIRRVLSQAAGERENATILIADSFGNLIYSSEEDTVYPSNIGQEGYFKEIVETAAQEKGFLEVKYQRRRNVLAYTEIPKYNWKLMRIMPRDLFYQASRTVRLWIFLIGLIAILLGLAVSNFFTRSIYTPIRSIMENVLKSTGKTTKKYTDEYSVINEGISNMMGKISNLEDTINENRPLIKNNMVTRLIHNTIGTQRDLDEFLKLTGRTFEGSQFVAVIYQLDRDIIENLTIENSAFMIYNIIEEIESMSGGGVTYIGAELQKDRLVVLAGYQQADTALLMKDTRYISEYLFSNFYMSSTVAIGLLVDQPLLLYRSYEAALTAMKYQFLMPRMCVVYSEHVIVREQSKAIMPEEYIAEFQKVLCAGGIDEVRSCVHEIVMQLVHGEYSADYCNTKMLELVSSVSAYLRELRLKSSDILEDDLANAFGSIEDIYEFEEWIVRTVKSIYEHLKQRQESAGQVMIENAKNYISKNLAEDLSLNRVAEKIFISPQYLSKVFKDETGMNFVDYVTQTRMEKAKEMLTSTNENIETIAGKVGYNTPHYFIKKFKERYGVTPRNYRQNQ